MKKKLNNTFRSLDFHNSRIKVIPIIIIKPILKNIGFAYAIEICQMREQEKEVNIKCFSFWKIKVQQRSPMILLKISTTLLANSFYHTSLIHLPKEYSISAIHLEQGKEMFLRGRKREHHLPIVYRKIETIVFDQVWRNQGLIISRRIIWFF